MNRLALFVAVFASACGPGSESELCSEKLKRGDLVVTEVFADAKAPP